MSKQPKLESKKYEESIKSHLIDMEGFGVKQDDYGTFLEKRLAAIYKGLKKRLESQI